MCICGRCDITKAFMTEQPSNRLFRHLCGVELPLWCWLVVACYVGAGCAPSWIRPLGVTPPKKPELQIKWFRQTFYTLAQQERKRQDGGDRVRRLLRKYPKLAKLAYLENIKELKKRQEMGEEIENLDRYYIIMNALIRLTFPKRKWPRFKLNAKPPAN